MRPAPVFVTGVAAATCCGLGAQAFWDQLARRDIVTPALAATQRRFTGNTTPLGSRRRLHDADRLTAYLLAALDYDLGAFLSELSDHEREHVGVALGTAYGHLSNYLAYFKTGTEQGYQLANPRLFPTTLPNWGTVSVSDAYSLWGSSTPITSGLTAGLEAIAYAAEAIHDGQEQSMIAGGYDELSPYTGHVLEGLTTSSPAGTRIRTTPLTRIPPADGVGILLLQSSDAAKASKRKPLATYGATVMLHGLWWDAPAAASQAAEAVERAVVDSGLTLSDIAAVFPSAGFAAADDLEAQLLHKVFGPRLSTLDMVPVKAVTGECFAAAGALQCIAAVEYLAHEPPAMLHDDPLGVLILGVGYDGTFGAAVFGRSPA